MKTTILTIALALASAVSALAQTVMRENSTVYFKTNVYLHDDPTNALHTRIYTVEGWGDHAEEGYLTSLWTNNIDANDMEIYDLNKLGVGLITGQGGTGRGIYPHYGEFHGAWNFQTDEPTVKGSRISLLQTPATDTNSYIRPDGGTNTISFDVDGNMIVAVDGSPALTISPAGDVGVGVTPSAGFSLRTDASFYAGGQVRAGSYVMAGNGQVFLNSAGTSWLQSDGTNLFFVSTVPPGFTNALTTNTP